LGSIRTEFASRTGRLPQAALDQFFARGCSGSGKDRFFCRFFYPPCHMPVLASQLPSY
jgi:hypothetical protein